MKKLLPAVLVVLAMAAAVTLWLADRPIDTLPQLPDGMGHMVFNPQFGPRTPQDVDKYLQNRAVSHRMGMEDAIATLQRRWGLRPGMTQDEIDAVRGQQEKIWAYVENTRTLRYKIRSRLGLNQ